MSSPIDELGILALDCVFFTQEAIFEGNAKRRRLIAGRDDVERIRLRYGSVARHPVVLFLFGVALVGLGIVPIPGFVDWWFHGGVLLLTHVLAVGWLVLGAAALYQASRRGYMLDVQTPTGWKRIEFSKRVLASELETFANRVEGSFGYTIERSFST
jgi:hypothetical protein